MEDAPPEDAEIPLEDHLKEIRDRLLVVLIPLVIFTCISFVFSPDVIAIATRSMLPQGTKLIVLNPLEYLYMRFLLSIVVALIFCIPLAIYEIFCFLKPGLFPNERKFFIKIVPASLLFFILGSAISYLWLAPFSARYLLSYAEGVATPMIVLSRFISFLSFMLLSIGTIFQLPLIVSFLVKSQLVNISELQRKRKYVYALLLIVAVTIVPDPTPVTPLIILLTFCAVYELSIIFARWI